MISTPVHQELKLRKKRNPENPKEKPITREREQNPVSLPPPLPFSTKINVLRTAVLPVCPWILQGAEKICLWTDILVEQNEDTAALGGSITCCGRSRVRDEERAARLFPRKQALSFCAAYSSSAAGASSNFCNRTFASKNSSSSTYGHDERAFSRPATSPAFRAAFSWLHFCL